MIPAVDRYYRLAHMIYIPIIIALALAALHHDGGMDALALTVNAIPKASGAATLANSMVTDDGTTLAVNVNKLTVNEANGNTGIAGTFDAVGSITATSGTVRTALSSSVLGGFVGTLSNDYLFLQTQGVNGIEIDNGQNTIFFNGNHISVGGGSVTLESAVTGSIPTVNHGTLSADASNFIGRITGIGANTSVTLTFGSGVYSFSNTAHCLLTVVTTGGGVGTALSTSVSKTAPIFTCTSPPGGAIGSAANCPDLEYQCWGN